jgi:hypothetical protein
MRSGRSLATSAARLRGTTRDRGRVAAALQVVLEGFGDLGRVLDDQDARHGEAGRGGSGGGGRRSPLHDGAAQPSG